MHWGGDADGQNEWGWLSLVGAAVELNDEKNRDERGGLLAVDGRRLVRSHNNQMTVDESGVMGDEGEVRLGRNEQGNAVASVRPSN